MAPLPQEVGAVFIKQITNVPEIDISQSLKSGGTVRLHIGQTARIRAHRNGGTAYFWDATVSDASIISIANDGTERDLVPPTPMVGIPESDLFTVRALQAGMATVTMSLEAVRVPPIASIVVTFVVEGS